MAPILTADQRARLRDPLLWDNGGTWYCLSLMWGWVRCRYGWHERVWSDIHRHGKCWRCGYIWPRPTRVPLPIRWFL